MSKTYDLVCVGDTTLDTFLKIHDAALHCDLKTRACELCFRYGEKIPVEQVVQNPGGNSANVAVGTATLGVKTALYASLGDDETGRKVERMVGERRVDTNYFIINKGKQTNYSTIISFKGERTILEMKYPAHLTFKTFPKIEWVYLSSIKQDPKTIYEPLVRLKKKMGFKLAFNPGIYQLNYQSNDLKKFLPFVDVLIVNKEEALIIIANKSQPAHYTQQDILKRLYRMVEDRGLVFVTDGERGAYGFDGNKIVHCKIFPASAVVDRTGAGDAFSSGVMASIVRGASFPEMIRWGMANSAAVLREIGPQNGLLTHAGIQRILAKVVIKPKLLT